MKQKKILHILQVIKETMHFSTTLAKKIVLTPWSKIWIPPPSTLMLKNPPLFLQNLYIWNAGGGGELDKSRVLEV